MARLSRLLDETSGYPADDESRSKDDNYADDSNHKAVHNLPPSCVPFHRLEDLNLRRHKFNAKNVILRIAPNCSRELFIHKDSVRLITECIWDEKLTVVSFASLETGSATQVLPIYYDMEEVCRINTFTAT